MAKKSGNNEGSIRKRPDGKWEARITVGRNPQGKQIQRSIYADTRSEVSKKMNDILGQLNDGAYIAPNKLTVEKWMIQWLNTYASVNLRPSSYTSCEGHIYNHINPAIGSILLKDLTTDRIQLFYNSKLKSEYDNLSAKTIRNIHITFHCAIEQAYKNKLIPVNIADGVILPKLEKKEMRVLSKEEQALLTSKLFTERLGFAILLDLSTGLRIGELCGLKWSDFNFDTKSFQVKRTLQRITSPKKKQVDTSDIKTKVVEGKVKTDKGYREIPLQSKIFDELIKYKKQQDNEKIKAGCAYADNDYVFASEIGGCIEPSTMRDVLNRLLKSTCIKHANFHSLRHTFATRAIEAGVSIKAVSEILGHASIQITLDLYCHASIDMKREAMDKMADLWQ